MKRIAIVLLFFLQLGYVHAQDKAVSIRSLYDGTNDVFELIGKGKHIDALFMADSLINLYADFQGSDSYLTYLKMYKAEAYLSLGDLTLAMYCSSKALELAKSSQQTSLLPAILNNQAVVFLEMHDYQGCLSRCEEILKEYTSSIEFNNKLAVLNNIAFCAGKLQNIERADFLYQYLLSEAQDHKDHGLYDKFLTHRNYGMLLHEQNQNDLALEHLCYALDGFSDSLGTNHYETGYTHFCMGELFFGTEDYVQSENHLNKAIDVLSSKDGLKYSDYEIGLVKALNLRSNLFLHIAKLELAQKDAVAAIQIIRRMMDLYTATRSGFIMARIVRPVYNHAITIQIHRFRETNELVYLDEAIRLSSEAKRMSLFLRFEHKVSRAISPELDKLYQEYYAYHERIEQGQQLPDQELDITILSQIRRKIDSLQGLVAYEKEVSKKLDLHRTQILISYHDFENYYGVFVRTKGSGLYRRITKDGFLLEAIYDLKSMISEERYSNYTREELNRFLGLSTRLYERLIAGIAISKGKVIAIQADGELVGVPFEILVDSNRLEGGKDHTGFRDLPYLIRSNSVYYLNSVSQRGKTKTVNRDRIAIVSTNPKNRTPHEQREIEGISRCFWNNKVVKTENEYT